MKTLATFTPAPDGPGLVPFVNVSDADDLVRVMVRTAQSGTIGTIMTTRDQARALFADALKALG